MCVWSHCLNSSASTPRMASKWQHLFPFFSGVNASVAPSPPPAAFFCSTRSFGADIPAHHWSIRRTNGNPPACWNYWWLSSLPLLSPIVTTAIFAYSLLSHPPLTSLLHAAVFSVQSGLRIYYFTTISLSIDSHPFLHLSSIRMPRESQLHTIWKHHSKSCKVVLGVIRFMIKIRIVSFTMIRVYLFPQTRKATHWI